MRLIDADALHIEIELAPYYVCEQGRKKQYGTRINKSVRFGPGETLLLYEDVSTFILESPIADAEPVRRGQWTEDGCCSECGEMGLYNGNEEIVRSRYCPHCGAKMDAKGGLTCDSSP